MRWPGAIPLRATALFQGCRNTAALGFAAGPLLGGFLLNHFRWGAIFLVNLPVAALGLTAVAALVPESKNPRGDRPDLPGALLSTLGTTALVYAIISGPEHGWTSGRVLLTAAVAVLVLGCSPRTGTAARCSGCCSSARAARWPTRPWRTPS